MTYQDFYLGLGELMRWFKAKLTEDQIKLIYMSVKSHTKSAWEGAVKNIIENGKPSPGYFPTIKVLRDECWLYTKDHPQAAAPIQYDQEYDNRFPLDLLFKGFDILVRTKGDEHQLRKFAAAVRMPRSDIDAVLCKYRAAYSVKAAIDANGKIGFQTEGGQQ